jgi:hypothetical protein
MHEKRDKVPGWDEQAEKERGERAESKERRAEGGEMRG